jgi:hypothetical protein
MPGLTSCNGKKWTRNEAKMLPISIIMNPDEPHIVIWYKNKRFNMHVLQSQTDKKNQAAVRGRTSEENIFAIY